MRRARAVRGMASIFTPRQETLIQIGLISGLSAPHGIALDGQGHVFVANFGSGTVGEYNVGANVNAALISGLDRPSGIALGLYGRPVRVLYGSGTIGEYNLRAVVNASLVPAEHALSGLVSFRSPSSLALARRSLGAILLRREGLTPFRGPFFGSL